MKGADKWRKDVEADGELESRRKNDQNQMKETTST